MLEKQEQETRKLGYRSGNEICKEKPKRLENKTIKASGNMQRNQTENSRMQSVE
jgi:hypothetical protein